MLMRNSMPELAKKKKERNQERGDVVSRYIQPLGLRVLIRVLREDDIHSSGLYLPAGSKEQMAEALYGEVIEVARARPDADPEDEGLGTNVSGVPCGAKVLFPKEEGIRVPWDESLRLLDVKNILATVEEIRSDQTH